MNLSIAATAHGSRRGLGSASEYVYIHDSAVEQMEETLDPETVNLREKTIEGDIKKKGKIIVWVLCSMGNTPLPGND